VGWVGGEGLRYGWMGGQREKVREVYGFSSLVKQNKKGKNCAVFCFAGFFFLKFLCYEVIVKQKIYKRSTNHYYR
jgi:hypothetical protein